MSRPSVSRRGVLIGAAAALVAAGGIERAYADELAALRAHPVGPDRIWLRRSDGSAIASRYRAADGNYDPRQMLMLSWFMRDLQDDDRAVWMEPRLFDLLAKVQNAMSAIHGAPLPITVTSGYRTPAHNARLEGAARNSMHLYGYAADVVVADYPPRATALAASFFPSGGIGIYDTFTHLDTWKNRLWVRAEHGRSAAGTPAPVPPGSRRHPG